MTDERFLEITKMSDEEFSKMTPEEQDEYMQRLVEVGETEDDESGGEEEGEKQRPDYDLVLTLTGTDDKVEEVAVNVLAWAKYDEKETLAQHFCSMVNSGELLDDDAVKNGRWGHAQIVDSGEYIKVRAPVRFESIKKMKDRAVQDLLIREFRHELASALVGADDALKAKVFKNMSKNAAAELKESIEREEQRGADMEVIKTIRETIVFCIKNYEWMYENKGENIFEEDEK